MDELDHRGQFDMPAVANAATARRQQHEDRPQPLAAGVDDVMADAFHQPDPRMQLLDNRAVHGREVVFDRRQKLRKHKDERQSVNSDARRAHVAPPRKQAAMLGSGR